MFKNPSLNNVFSNIFDGFYIFSTYSEIEIILRQLANNLSKSSNILYIANSDISNLNHNIYYAYIFNKNVLKKLQKFKKFDYIFIENISFLDEYYDFYKKTKIIACGFSKNDLRHFKNRKTRVLKFIYNDYFFALKSKKVSFKYIFNSYIKQGLFSPNKHNFADEIDFYLNCLNQGFRFYDYRNSRKNEILKAFNYGNLYINNKAYIKEFSNETFNLNDKIINCNFIPNGKVIYNAKISIKENSNQKKSLLFKLYRLFFKYVKR